MVSFRSVQLHIDRGRGIAANKVGEPVNVYRVGVNPLATSIFDPGNLLTTINEPTRCKFIKDPPGKYVENMNIGDLVFELVMNASFLLPGDFIVQNDPFYDNNAMYYLAQKRPVAKNIGVRVENLAQIFRPVSLRPGDNYAGIVRNPIGTNSPLVLSGGQFSFGSPGATPVMVPVGMQTQHRVHADIISDVPNTTRIAYWFLAIPPLPGVKLQEGDWVAIYEVTSASPGSLAGVGDPNAGLAAVDQYVQGSGKIPPGVTVSQRFYKIHLPYYNPFGMVGYQAFVEDIKSA